MNPNDDYSLIATLYRYGHFWSPEALSYDLVQPADLPKLTLSDAVVKAAVWSYQKWFWSDLSNATKRHHGRLAVADGEAGPATVDVLSAPRCGNPDHPNPQAAVMQANWPTTCRMDITTSYNMTLSGLTAAQLKQLWEHSEWEKVIKVKFRHVEGGYPNTRIFAFRANLGQNVLADQYLATNNCGYKSQGRFSNRQWTAQLWKTTKEHEHGHSLGCNHIQDPNSTMYPSIHQASLARGGALVASDVAEALRLGYERQTDEPTPPTPPTGTFRIEVAGTGNVSAVTARIL